MKRYKTRDDATKVAAHAAEEIRKTIKKYGVSIYGDGDLVEIWAEYDEPDTYGEGALNEICEI